MSEASTMGLIETIESLRSRLAEATDLLQEALDCEISPSWMERTGDFLKVKME